MRYLITVGMFLALAVPTYLCGNESWVLFCTLLILLIG